MDNEELITLLKDMEVIKAQQRTLSEKEQQCREKIYALMQDLGIEQEKSNYGNIRLQRRAEKDYGEAIKMMELQLKEAKKLADDMGNYVVKGYKESLVYTPPAELF